MNQSNKKQFIQKLQDITDLYPFASKMTDSLIRTYWETLNSYEWDEIVSAVKDLIEEPDRSYRPTVGDIKRVIDQKRMSLPPKQEPELPPPLGGYMRGEDLSIYIKTRDEGYEALRKAKITGHSARHIWIDNYMAKHLPRGHRMIAQHS